MFDFFQRCCKYKYVLDLVLDFADDNRYSIIGQGSYFITKYIKMATNSQQEMYRVWIFNLLFNKK